MEATEGKVTYLPRVIYSLSPAAKIRIQTNLPFLKLTGKMTVMTKTKRPGEALAGTVSGEIVNMAH